MAKPFPLHRGAGTVATAVSWVGEVDVFALRLRDQVDLDALRSELLSVIDQTMQPTRASLWLRAPANPRPTGSAHPSARAL